MRRECLGGVTVGKSQVLREGFWGEESVWVRKQYILRRVLSAKTPDGKHPPSIAESGRFHVAIVAWPLETSNFSRRRKFRHSTRIVPWIASMLHFVCAHPDPPCLSAARAFTPENILSTILSKSHECSSST